MVLPPTPDPISEINDRLDAIDGLLADTIEQLNTAISDMNDAIASANEKIAEAEKHLAGHHREKNRMPDRERVVKDHKPKPWRFR